MKNSVLFSFCLYCYSTVLYSQPTFTWAKSMGGTSSESGYSIAVDGSGNVYTTGPFSGTVDFDPGTGTTYLTSVGTGGSTDIFISKLDASGNFVWAKRIGDISSDFSHSVEIDASGNVYTTGNFSGTVDFDPGPGIANLTSAAGSIDIFISKLDASGNFVWAKNMGGFSSDIGYYIIVDAFGNVYTTGFFNETADFDPGPGIANLISAGFNDIFISKLDASGNFVWAKKMGGASNDVGRSMAMDASGNFYTTGYFDGTVDFDPGAGEMNLTSAGFNDIFISKLDASGNFVWARKMGGTDPDGGMSITVDASENVYSTGVFSGTADFDPGDGSFNLTSAGGTDIFISKLDPSGYFLWTKNIGGTAGDICNSMSLNSDNVYITGHFLNTVDFDPGGGSFNLTSAGGTDIFISKFDVSGNFVWATNMGGPALDEGLSIEVDAFANLHITGDFYCTADFDPGSGTYNLTSNGCSEDIFVVKLAQSPLPLTLLDFSAKFINVREIELRWETSSEQNTARFDVERSMNGTDFASIGSISAARNSSSIKSYSFTDDLPASNHQLATVFYRLKMIDVDQTFTHSKIIAVRLNAVTKQFHIFPNPVNDLLHVQTSGINQTTTLLITDLTGKVLRQQKVLLSSSTSFSVDVRSLTKGKYYLILGVKENKQVQQFMKL